MYLGKEVTGEEMEFSNVKEDWNIYKAEDGSTLKVKVIVAKIIRADIYNDSGEPIYIINSQPFVVADVPESLMKKK